MTSDPWWTLTVAADDGPEVTYGPAGLDSEHVARAIFHVVVGMVTRPGNKREGDAVKVTLYDPVGTVVEQYRREAL